MGYMAREVGSINVGALLQQVVVYFQYIR